MWQCISKILFWFACYCKRTNEHLGSENCLNVLKTLPWISPLMIAPNRNTPMKYFSVRRPNQLTRWTPCEEYTSAGLCQAALALPSPCFDESRQPASFHCRYAARSGPRRPAGSLDRRTSCSWNPQWQQSAETLVRQWKHTADNFSGGWFHCRNGRIL